MRRDRDAAAWPRRIERVQDEIDHDLLHLRRIGVNPWKSVVDVLCEDDVPLPRSVAEQGEDLVDDHGDLRWLKLRRLRPDRVEQRRDDA